MPYGVVLKDVHFFSVPPMQKQLSAYGAAPLVPAFILEGYLDLCAVSADLSVRQLHIQFDYLSNAKIT